jgi:hypothetical protein
MLSDYKKLVVLFSFLNCFSFLYYAVEDALAHPYLATLHDINDEPACASPFEFDFEEPSISEENIKDLIWMEALLCSANHNAMMH